MANVINATSTGNGGLVSQGDDSGILNIQTNETTAITVDTSQNVGIGTASPTSSSVLDVVSGGNTFPRVRSSIGSSAALFFQNSDTGTTTSDGMYVGITSAEEGIIWNNENTDLRIATNNTERMRLTSGGDLCAGTTSTLDGSRATFTKAGAAGVAVNRTSDDGALYRCYKDGTSVGYIGTLDANSIFLGNFQTNDVALRFIGVTNDIRPCTSTGTNRDNAVDFGDSSARFVNIWATNGSIQTSDANEKQDIEELSEAETRVAVALKGLLKKYRWKHRVATEGDDARIHFGIIAQDLKTAFEAEGLDAHRYSMFIYSTWVDDETGEQRTRMGVRYNELLAFMVAAL